jgi:hypothetical protein
MELPAEPQMRWVLRTSASLLELGAEPVSGLVLPTAEFFPDKFDGTPGALAALMTRVQDHAGLGDLEVDLGVVMPEGEALKVSCSSGACGGMGKLDTKLERVTRVGEGKYRVMLDAGEVRQPVLLTTALVRAVSVMFMVESGAYEEAVLPADRDAATDLAAVLLGFGVLAANGSYIYMKGCGGVQVHSATRMPVEDVTLALAVFCKLHNVPDRVASKHLELTPRECFDEAMVWASSNISVIRRLRSAPAAMKADEFHLSEARSWLSRVLGIGARKAPRSVDEELAELERQAMRGKLPAGSGGAKGKAGGADEKRLAEIRALVDETLGQ